MMNKTLFMVILLGFVGPAIPMGLNNLNEFVSKEHESTSALAHFQDIFKQETGYTLGYERLETVIKKNEQSFKKLANHSPIDKRDLFMGWFYDLVKVPIIDNGIAQQIDTKVCIDTIQEQIDMLSTQAIKARQRNTRIKDYNKLFSSRKKLKSPISYLLYYFGINPLFISYRWYTNYRAQQLSGLVFKGEQLIQKFLENKDNILLNAYDFLTKSSVYQELIQSDQFESTRHIIRGLKEKVSTQDQELTVDDRPDSDVEEPIDGIPQDASISLLTHDSSNEPSTSGSASSCIEQPKADYSIEIKPVVAQHGNNCGYHALFNAVNADQDLTSKECEGLFYKYMAESKTKVHEDSIGDRGKSWTQELLQEDEMKMLKEGMSEERKNLFVLIPDIHRYVKGDGPLDKEVLEYLKSSQEAIAHYKNMADGKIIKHIFVLGTMNGLGSKSGHWIAVKQEITQSGIRYSVMDSSPKDFVHPIAERFVQKVLHGREFYHALSAEDSQSVTAVLKDLNYFKILNLGIYALESSGGYDAIEVYSILPSEIIQRVLEGCLNLLDLELIRTHNVLYGEWGKFDPKQELQKICDKIMECDEKSLNYKLFTKDSTKLSYKVSLTEGQLGIIEYIREAVHALS